LGEDTAANEGTDSLTTDENFPIATFFSIAMTPMRVA
jgi:hypothetical protein